MKKNIFTKTLAMLLSAGLVCTMLPAVSASAEEPAVNEPAKQVLSLSTTTTTTTTPATEPVIDMCYSTLVEYDRTELAVGDVMEVRFWNPETGECSGGDISEVSDNISYEYEEDTGTIYITALSAGVGKMYVREYTCAFGAYVTFNVTDGQITAADSASTTTTAFTGTMTTPPAETTVATTLRTTETMAPDETRLTVEIDALENWEEVEFGQSLENVYSVMFEFDNVSLSDEDRVYLRFDVDNGVDYYQVLYPMSIFSYSSTDKWWSEVQLANSFSCAIVRLPEGGWGTVSWLDVDASDVSDMLFDAVKTSDKAVFEIVQSEFEDSPVFTGTTADTADTVTTYTTTAFTAASTPYDPSSTALYEYEIPVGQSVTVPVYFEDLNSTVETVTVDGGNTIIEITKTENLGNLINLHISTLSVGEDTIRLYLDDGSEFTVSITVKEVITTSATTATTVSTSNTPDSGNTTLPTTYYSTTFPTTSHSTTTAPPHTTMTTTSTTVPTGTITPAGTTATTGTTAQPETGRHNADTNGDGDIDLDDAVRVLTVYSCSAVGLTPEGMTEEQAAYADADGNGTVTLDDAVKILTYYSMKAAGLQPSWVQII